MFAEHLAIFGPAMKKYADSVKGLDPGVVSASADAAAALGGMAGNLPNQGGMVSWFAGDNTLSSFASELEVFGPSFKRYSDSVKGLDAGVVTASANAALTLSEMAAKLPDQGGMASWFVGGNSLSAFAAELEVFGPSIKRYSDSVKGIDASAAAASANAALTLSEMAKNLPKQGGIAGLFAGSGSLPEFAKELEAFGPPIKRYSDSVKGLDAGLVTASANAASALAEMADKLPNQGGVASWFAGENTLSAFGAELAKFAPYLASYGRNVSGLNGGAVTNSANAAKVLAELAAGLTSGGNGLASLGGDAAEFGRQFKIYYDYIGGVVFSRTQGVAGAVNALTAMARDVTSADVGGLATFAQDLRKQGDLGITGFVNAFNDAVPAVRSALQNVVETAVREISAGQPRVVSQAETLATTAAGAVSAKAESFSAAGDNIVNGLIAGIRRRSPSAVQAAVTMAANTLKAVKQELEIKSPSEKFEREVGSNIALGTERGITKNGDKAAKAAAKMASDANGAAKLWIMDYQNDSEYLVSEELAMWRILAEKYKSVSKEKVEIDKNIRRLEDEINKERIAANKDLLDSFESYVKHKKKLGELSAQDEIDIWEEAQKAFEEGADERTKVDEELYAARQRLIEEQENAEKKEFENTKKWISEKKKIGELTLLEEVQAWEAVQSRYAEGTELRKNAEAELYAARERLTEKQKSLSEEMAKEEERYASAVEDRAKALAGSFGLFDELSQKEEVSGKTLTDNLKSQVGEFQDWADNLSALSKKGVDEGLLAELRKMGPSANAEIKALSKMSERELTDYGNLWKEKSALARTQAVSELEGLRKDTNKKIKEIKAELNALQEPESSENTEKFAQTGLASMDAVIGGYNDKKEEAVETADGIASRVNDQFASWAPAYAATAEILIQAVIKGFENKRPDVLATVKTIVARSLIEIGSSILKWYEAGRYVVGGFVEGMRSKIEDAASAAAGIAEEAYDAAMRRLGINSPSKAFMELGRFSVLGFAEGFGRYSYLAEASAIGMGGGVLGALKQAMDSVGEVIDGGLDTAPVIRPVIDLDAVDSGIRDINGRRLNLAGIIGAASITAGTVNRRPREPGAQGGESAGETRLSFTQNNYSPKALSRLEIYRQTRNQFSAMKEALG
jgi:hypothetical protein